MATSGKPAFGFVVIGRNEGQRLRACLAALKSFAAPIVYSDSGSTDGSPELAAAVGATVVRLDPGRPMNAARGRAEGFDRLMTDHPSAEFVQFVDGDCVLQPGWVEQALGFFADNPRAAAVCGRRFELHAGATLYNRMCDAEWDTPVGPAEACGGDAMMRVSAYREVRGFRADLMAGEEPELCARMRTAGWEIWRIDAAMTEHDAAITSLRQWLRRSMRGGFGYMQVWQATRDLPSRLYGRQLRSAFIWSLGVPVTAAFLAAMASAPLVLAVIPALFAGQIARIAFRDGGGAFAWQRASLFMAGKLSEAVGAMRFLFRSKTHSIGYKTS